MMKILIISDTHGHHRNFDRVMERVGKMDMIIHLGDIEGGEEYIKAVADCPVQCVAGNNDFFSELDREKEFYVGRYHIFATHGHYYYVSLNTERIKQEGLARKANIVMFGHTHKPLVEIGEDITIINPGSLSYPRQEGRRGSFILMEIDNKGTAHFTVNYV